MIFDLFESPAFQGMAGGASIISLVWIFSSFGMSFSRKLFFSKKNFAILKIGHLSNFRTENAKIVCGMGPINIVYFLVLNCSRNSITDSDFVEGPEIRAGSNTELVEAIIPDDQKLKPCRLEVVPKCIKLCDVVLKPFEGTVIKVLYYGDEEPVLSAATREQPNLLPNEFRLYRAICTISKLEFPAVIGIMLVPLGVLLCLKWYFDFAEKIGSEEMLNGYLISFLIFVGPVFWILTEVASSYAKKKRNSVEAFWSDLS